jgi:hypothetical protein
LTMNDADLEIVGDQPGVFNFFHLSIRNSWLQVTPRTHPRMVWWHTWLTIHVSPWVRRV